MGATAGLWRNHGRDLCSDIWNTHSASGPTGPMTVVSAALVAASIQLTGSLETAMGLYFGFSVGWPFADRLDSKHCWVWRNIFPASFLVYEWSGSNHYTSSIIPLCGTHFSKINLRNIGGLARLFEFNIHALLWSILTVLICHYFHYSLKAIPSALAALIGALRAIFRMGRALWRNSSGIRYRWNPLISASIVLRMVTLCAPH
jgi:SulP family sulfate permease